MEERKSFCPGKLGGQDGGLGTLEPIKGRRLLDYPILGSASPRGTATTAQQKIRSGMAVHARSRSEGSPTVN